MSQALGYEALVFPSSWQAGCTMNAETGSRMDTGVTLQESDAAIQPVKLPQIVSGNRVFDLREPITAKRERCDDLWTFECERLHLLGYGPSIEEALEAFMTDFVVAYDGLVEVDDDLLTLDAQAAKKLLKELVYPVAEVA